MRGVDDRRVHHHVVIEKFGWPTRVSEYAPDGPRGQVDVFRTIRAEPVVHGSLVAKIELLSTG